jgi:hypothetical protein
MFIKNFFAGIIAITLIISVSNALAESDSATKAKTLIKDAIHDPLDKKAFAAWAETLPKYGDLYVVDGDILMSELEMRNYLITADSAGAPPQRGELIVNCKGGLCDKWPLDNRELSYSIDNASFRDGAKEISKNMKQAGEDWMKVCPKCKLSFKETDAPSTPLRKPAHFIVKRVSNAGFIAASFFPSDPESEMVLMVDDSYFNTNFDHIGVLRHEIGHILGYRHEHIEGIPGCFREGGEWLRITVYTPNSVMHYPCGGGGDPKLQITATDKQGHINHYMP